MAVSAEGITSPDGRPVVLVPDRETWRAWLAANHDTVPAVWLVIGKKGRGVATPTYDEAVGEALAFGWIDSKANAFDDAVYLQSFSPRRPKSMWSASNRERVARLIAEDRMAPAGLAAVEDAQRRGLWGVRITNRERRRSRGKG
jgi:uncharacterized protein YdeI (YjbR/CyaY-like superfamily)